MIDSLAIIAPNRFQTEELVYIRDFECERRPPKVTGTKSLSGKSEDEGGDDPLFGYDTNASIFFGEQNQNEEDNVIMGKEGPLWNQCSVAHQFRLLSAWESFDTAATYAGNRMYAGLICASESFVYYGWRTSTRVKIIISVKDDILPTDRERNEAREVYIQKILKQIHTSYVEHTLNPFSSKVGRIDSQRFHDNITRIATIE